MGLAVRNIRSISSSQSSPSKKITNKELSHHHVEYHHQDKADGKSDGAEITVLTAGGLGDKFLDNYIEHSTSCKG